MSRRPEAAFTGPTPESGYPGFVNIRENFGDPALIDFTVRAQGDGGQRLAVFSLPRADATQLLADAIKIAAGTPEG